jgi:4-hydroxybenzoate polyprenyltransferase
VSTERRWFGDSALLGLLYGVRPWQWYKQGVLLVAVVFSANVFAPAKWAAVAVAVASFTAVAGAAYLFNDVNDVEADRAHPEKRHRPVASGVVSVPLALGAASVLVVVGGAAGATLGVDFLAVLGAYVAQNVLYSVWLKRVPFLDVVLVAAGFVLRAVAGVVAVDVVLSPWLIVTSFLFALMLALGKREHEVASLDDPADARGALAAYAATDVDRLRGVTTAILLMAYSLYTLSGEDPTMMVTLPAAFFGVFRYQFLLDTTDVGGRPARLLADRQLLATLALWTLAVVFIVYDAPARLAGVAP